MSNFLNFVFRNNAVGELRTLLVQIPWRKINLRPSPLSAVNILHRRWSGSFFRVVSDYGTKDILISQK